MKLYQIKKKTELNQNLPIFQNPTLHYHTCVATCKLMLIRLNFTVYLNLNLNEMIYHSNQDKNIARKLEIKVGNLNDQDHIR